MVTVYLSKSDVTVIAAVRDLESISTKALSSLPKAKNSSLITVKIDSSLEQDAIAAVRTLESEHSISKIDVVIANAGTSASLGPVASITAEQVLDNVTVNSLGSILHTSKYFLQYVDMTNLNIQ